MSRITPYRNPLDTRRAQCWFALGIGMCLGASVVLLIVDMVGR